MSVLIFKTLYEIKIYPKHLLCNTEIGTNMKNFRMNEKKIYHLSFPNCSCRSLFHTKHFTFEPRCEKTGLLGFRPGLTHTGLYSYRSWLEASNFIFRKKRDCTIHVAKTKALISFAVTKKLICVFVFADAKIRFSHDVAHLIHNGYKFHLSGCEGCNIQSHISLKNCVTSLPVEGFHGNGNNKWAKSTTIFGSLQLQVCFCLLAKVTLKMKIYR